VEGKTSITPKSITKMTRRPKRLKHLTKNTERTIFKSSKSKRKRRRIYANKLQLRKRNKESRLLTKKLIWIVKKKTS